MEKKMRKGEDKQFNNLNTCVLKVNIHCDGCLKKVKKLLSKIDGVYTSSIDADQGKVTVVGNVDSATIIKKLCKAGKHAEEWPTKGGNQKMNLTSQLQKLQLDHAKGLPLQLPQLQHQHKTKEHNGKKGGGGGKEHKEPKQKEQKSQSKGLKGMISNMKDFKFPFKKEKKKVKFNLPSDEDDDFVGDYSDFSDEYEDGDGFDGFHNNPKMMKGLKIPVIAKDKKGTSGGNGVKGVQVQVPNKAKNKGGKNGGDAQDNKKKGGGNNKGANSHGNQQNNGKKGNDGFGGGGGGGHQPNVMGHGYMNFGQMGNMQQGMGQMPSMHGLPPGAGGAQAGYYNGGMGMAPQEMMAAGGIAGNISLQQQYMQALMQQQQQQQRMMNQGGAAGYPQMGYGYGYSRPAPPPPMYVPSSQSNYAMFSDENPDGCSIM